MKIIRFEFEDQGQDFTWWDVADNGHGVGKVIDCGPFQASLWANGSFHVNLLEPHGVGDRLVTTDNIARAVETGEGTILKYPVTKVEHREKPVCVECHCIDERACVTDGVPCHWAAPDLCSACAAKEQAA